MDASSFALRLLRGVLPWLMALGCALAPTAGRAQDDPAAVRPLTLSADYFADVTGVPAGGAARGARFLDNLIVAADADLDAAAGWHGARAHVSLLNNLGGKPNRLAGSIQGINNVEVADPRLKLYEAWAEQRIGEAATLRAGLYDVNTEFYQNDAAGLLISPMFGVGSELAATGVNGPAIFPSTALAVRLRVTQRRLYGAAAVVNARAGTLGDAHGIDLSGRDGALLIGEAGWTGNGRIAIGAWRYTRTQPRIAPPDVSLDAGYSASTGVYVLAERTLAGRADAPRQLTGFARFGLSEGKTTPFRGGWQTGLLLRQPIPSRPASALSIGAGCGILSGFYRAANPPGQAPLARHETILEATYSDTLAKGVALQPDVQYVIRPSGDPRVRNALVLGIRLKLSWSNG